MPQTANRRLPRPLADHPRAASIEPVNIPAPPQFAADGEVETVAAVAFRHRLPVGVRALPVEYQRGLMAYADAVERVAGAGGGGPDLSGVRAAPVGAPAGPVLSKLGAAEELRKMNAALAGVALEITRGGKSAAQRRRGLVIRVPGADLAHWLAIEGLSAAAMLRRAGIAQPSKGDMVKLREAVLAVGAALVSWG